MAEELNEDPQWEITVRVPMRLPVEMRQDLFEVVAQAVSRWEPVNRDGWDSDVFGCPEQDRLSYRDTQLLLWLHAEAVWKADQNETLMVDAETEFGSAMDEVDRAERDNNDLRREVSRLRREVEFEANAVSSEGEALRNIFLHVGDRVEFVRPDGRIARGEVVDVDPLRVLADDTGNVTANPSEVRKPPVCACSVDAAQLDPERWTRPQCAVHPDGDE